VQHEWIVLSKSPHEWIVLSKRVVVTSWPEAPQSGPEETVETVQGRAPVFAFQHGDLLAQREDLE
jgi:hypothetical protein